MINFKYEEFFPKDWNEKMENEYKIPKATLYNLIKSLLKQEYIVRKSIKPIKVVFPPIIKDILLIIEDNLVIPIKELRLRYNDQNLDKIIDRFVDAEILQKFTKNIEIYLKIIR